MQGKASYSDVYPFKKRMLSVFCNLKFLDLAFSEVDQNQSLGDPRS